MTDRPDNFRQALDEPEQWDEAPILSEKQAEVINSDYVDSYDEVLQILERSKRIRSDSLLL
ncbi:hypothetical protein [Desulfolucanica intricata]|uniref:hypothetical protein n=1 Tax=Desulfolucanica intricata TaxID=1285191 RepID=UPI00082F0114|nr:hypothetical protein [Desulfolucanica intricata]